MEHLTDLFFNLNRIKRYFEKQCRVNNTSLLIINNLIQKNHDNSNC